MKASAHVGLGAAAVAAVGRGQEGASAVVTSAFSRQWDRSCRGADPGTSLTSITASALSPMRSPLPSRRWLQQSSTGYFPPCIGPRCGSCHVGLFGGVGPPEQVTRPVSGPAGPSDTRDSSSERRRFGPPGRQAGSHCTTRWQPWRRAVPSGMPRACAARAARRDSLRAPAGDLWPATSHGRRRSRAQQKGPPWLPPPPPRRPRRPSRPRTTAPTTSRSSRGSRRCASARACTSARPTAAASCTACGRSSTTRSTRPSAGRVRPHRGHPPPRRLGRGARQRPRHPGRHRAPHRPHRRRGRLHQAARRRQVRRRLLRGLRRSARRRRVGRQRAVRAARRRGRPRRQDLRDVLPPRRARLLPRRRHGRQGPRPRVHPVRALQRAARRRQGQARA